MGKVAISIILMILSGTMLLFPFLAAAETAPITPKKEHGEIILFDADIHDLSAINNYTASWTNSDLIPVPSRVSRNGEEYVEFSFKGNSGMACSTVYFNEIPDCDEGMTYAGLELIIDYDESDYGKVSLHTEFSDKTLLTRPLTLEQGTETYFVKRGYRRASFPAKWGLLSYIRLSVKAREIKSDFKYRLKRIVLAQKKKTTASEPSAVNRKDANRFGQRLFCPQPKKILWKEGEFLARKHFNLFLQKDASARTLKTAEIFKEKYYGYTGNKLAIKEFEHTPPDKGIILRIEDSTAFDGKLEKLKEEGYCLVVDEDKITITAFDEPGLYYGLVTLFQLIKSSMKFEELVPIPCIEVLDFPDLQKRMCRLEHPHHFRDRKVKEKRGIDYLIDWTDRFVAGNKLNVFYLDLSAVIKYKRRPEFDGRERLYSLEDIRKFGEFCRDNFVEVCPTWQVGGHASWWLLVGYHPELREKGWNSQADVTHPDHDPIVFDCMLDVIEALKPKYLSPKSDEWWHKRKSGETPDKLLHGKTRASAFLDFHVKLNKWLKEKGITMMMFHDMLSPYHNGKRYDLYKIIDEFPKDTIILLWGGYDRDKDIERFVEKGFEVWVNPTGMFTVGEKSASLIKGYGKGMYSWGQCQSSLLDKYSGLWSQYVLLHSADYAWNIKSNPETNTGAQITSDRLVTLRNIFAVNPNPYAGEEIEPIDIGTEMTHSFNAFLKEMKAEEYAGHDQAIELETGVLDVGFVPTKIISGKNKNCIVLAKNSAEVSIPIDEEYSSLIFLHTAYINNPSDPEAQGAKRRQWHYGWPCGNYVVHYADGSQIVIPLRLPMNIKRFDTSHFNRSTNENRYVYALKDCNRSDVHFFQLEWVNPRPKQKISKVIFQHDNELDVSPILLAISGRMLFREQITNDAN